jgi:two-component system chemotaxis sensor kinase CheA
MAPPPGKSDGGGNDPPRLGEILVSQEGVAPEHVEAALKKQKRVGEILVEEKVVTPEQVSRALETQATAPRADAASIRVHTEKVDKLVNLVGEMVITQSMLAQIAARFSLTQLPRLTEAIAAMERHTRELQERVMAVRMQPIKTIFSRFHRLVRDLAGTLGKQIRLEVSGEETELDKTVIDRIGDPLTHLVRNSVDHGVESPDVRRAAGKPEQGVVRLHAFHQGGSIFIEVEDDGKGLDTARIQHKALENGLVKDGEALTDEQLYALIFRPGFSTAEQVTDVSGRGVGMDVVRRNILGLGGHVAITSALGTGTKFTITLPLTLAILDGLSVLVGDETYIIPLVHITESIRPKAAQVQTIVGNGEVVNVRGRVLPILRLHEVLGVVPRVLDPTESLLVLVENGREHVALLVDELVGQHQVVIKSLEANYQHVDGVSGATIMGDGRVALILDVPGLVQMASQRPALRAA